MLLGKEKIQDIIQNIKKYAAPDPVEIRIQSERSLLMRMSSSQLHQNTREDNALIHILLYGDQKKVALSTNHWEAHKLKAEVEYLKKTLPFAPKDKDLSLFPQIKSSIDFRKLCDDTARLDPADLGKKIEILLEKAKNNKIIAAGVLSAGVTECAVGNSLSDHLCYQSTADASLTTVFETEDDGSSWGSWAGSSLHDLDINSYSENLVKRCLLAKKPQDIKAGSYPVILESEAASDLLMFLGWLGLQPKSFEEGTSPLSGKVGKKIFDEKFNVVDDPVDETEFYQHFDAYGEKKKPLTLIENGILKNICYNHYYAHKYKKKSTAHETFGWGVYPTHVHVRPGTTSHEELIKSLERGILVTRFHYINVSNRKAGVLTGVTKDGTFLIENGKIKHPVRKLRFTQNVVEAFSKIDDISSDGRYVPETSFYQGRYLTSQWCPNFRLPAFNFSS